MAEITNIYVEHDYKKMNMGNNVFIRVINDGVITFIQSTEYGYKECEARYRDSIFYKYVKDYIYVNDRIINGQVVDLMKDDAEAYRIYTDGLNKAFFIDVTTSATQFPFKQIVFIKHNKTLGTNHIFGGEGVSTPCNLVYKPTGKVVTKKELIKDIIKEVKDSFPELKIKLNKINKNVNE